MQKPYKKAGKIIPFIPMLCFVLWIIIVVKFDDDYTAILDSGFVDLYGLAYCLPIVGLPIGVVGLAKGENKVLSIINIIIGSSIIILPLILMIIMIIGFSLM